VARSQIDISCSSPRWILPVGTVIVTTLEAVQLIAPVQKFLANGGAGQAGRLVPLGAVLQMVEGYLLAAILIIFALGLCRPRFRCGTGAGKSRPHLSGGRPIRNARDYRSIFAVVVFNLLQQSLERLEAVLIRTQ
jgi:hypothetical protein